MIAFVIALLIGLVGAVPLLLARGGAEQSSRDVTVLMAYEDAQTLGEVAGLETPRLLEQLRDAGVHGLLVSSAAEAEAAAAAGLETAGYTDAVAWNTTGLVLLRTEDGAAQVEAVAAAGATPVLVENPKQTGADLERAVTDAIEDGRVGCLKAFVLIPSFASRYRYLGGTGAEEIENILYRAVTDRNIRVLQLTPFLDNGEIVTDLGEYAEVLGSLSARIAVQHMTMEGHSTAAPYHVPSFALLLLTAVGICAGGVLLLWVIFRFGAGWQLGLLAVLVAASAAGLLLRRDMMVAALAFAAAVIWPCLAVAWTAFRLKQLRGREQTPGTALVHFAVTLISAVCCCLLGSAFIGAVMSDSRYLLEIALFSGVKVSQAVPILFALFLFWRAFYHQRGRSFAGDLRAAYAAFRHRALLKIVLIAVVVLAALAVYILRTGDGMLGVPALEQQLRNWMERTLYARPRTKEFLVAWPSLAVLVAAIWKDWKSAVLPFGVLTSVGFAGVCNTFCHARADLTLSLTRTFIGLAVGLILGALVLLILHAVSRRSGRKVSGDTP